MASARCLKCGWQGAISSLQAHHCTTACVCDDTTMVSIFGYCAKCGGTTGHRIEVNAVIPPGDVCETFDPELMARDHADEALRAIGIERCETSAVQQVFAIVESAWFAGFGAGRKANR